MDISQMLQALAMSQQTAQNDNHGKINPADFGLNPMPGLPGNAAPRAPSMVPRAERGMRVPPIRDQNHLNDILGRAEGDADLRAISRQMQKQGLDTSSLGID